MNKNLEWSMPLAAKLAITVPVGFMFASGTYYSRRNFIHFWIIALFWCLLVGTSLYRLEGNDWQRSVTKGLVIGLIGWIGITAAAYLWIVWWLQLDPPPVSVR